MVKEDLHAFGAEYPNITFEGFWDWFIRIDEVAHHWRYEPTYVIVHFLFLFGGVATFVHSIVQGGRLPYLWLGTILHGLVVECMCYVVPHIDNFWHSQTPIVLLGLRLPLHIVFLYPCFIYNSSIGVAKMRLPRWAEPFAVGLGSVLVDIPYDIVSVNFLHWTWHDTDPNIGDRHYWVPWNSYYFHASFAASFTFWFHLTRRYICRTKGKWESDSVSRELVCTILAGFLGTPGGLLLFIPNYHPLHDIFQIHSEVTFFILFTVFLLIIWSGDRTPKQDGFSSPYRTHWSTWILIVHLVAHYSSFLSMTIFFNAEDEVAIGLKEPIGNCDEYTPLQTIFGLELKKRKYLCPTDFDEKYYNWDCLPGRKPPSNGAYWYTACGVPLPNRAEYIAIISIICILGATVYGNLHFRSSGDAVFKTRNSSDMSNVTRKEKIKSH